MDKSSVFLIVVILIAIGLYIFYRKNFKILKVPSVCLITGGVKTGKTSLSVTLSQKDFKRRHRKWYFLKRFLHRDLEEPLFYTNCRQFSFTSLKRAKKKPHKLDRCIVQLQLEHLLRDYRFNYKSVIYIEEASLLADNFDFNNKDRNVQLSLFNKLIGHETHGGALYYDTQSVLDVHYSIKRVVSTYFFIHKNVNFLLFRVLYLRELINTENGVNNFNDDVDVTMRKVLIPFWYLKHFNQYEFSWLTDELDVKNEKIGLLKKLVSFNPFYIARAYRKKLERKDVQKEDKE